MSRGGFHLPPVDTVVVSVSPGETRAAALRDGSPWDLLIARDHRPDRTGSIYLGRVRRVEPALAAAFVDIGEGEVFLPLRGGAVHEGQAIPVQIVREAVAEKVAEASLRLTFPGSRLVLTPGRPGVAASRRIADKPERARLQAIVKRLATPAEGVIVRAAAAGCEEDGLATELRHLRDLLTVVQGAAGRAAAPCRLHRDLPPLLRWLRDEVPAGVERIVVDDGTTLSALRAEAGRLGLPAPERHAEAAALFETHGVEAEIDSAAPGEAAPLPSGGRIWMDRTRALTAIDVDTGAGTHHGRQADALAAANAEAAVEVARLVRFRGISGLIVADFAGAPAGAAAEHLHATLSAGFADDPAQVRILPASQLGLVEMSRERLRTALPDLLGPEATALAALRAVVRAAPIRPVLTVSPAVAALLDGALAPARGDAERKLGGPLGIRSTTDIASGRFTISNGEV